MSFRRTSGTARLLSLALGVGALGCTEEQDPIGDAVDGLVGDSGSDLGSDDPDVAVADIGSDAPADAEEPDAGTSDVGDDTAGDANEDAAPDAVADAVSADADADAPGDVAVADAPDAVDGDLVIEDSGTPADADATDLSDASDLPSTADADATPDLRDPLASALYSQLDALSGLLLLATDNPSTNAADIELADDFVVPEPGWEVTGLWLEGETTGTFAYTIPHVNVRLYADAEGAPGELSEEWLRYGGFVNRGGDLEVTLPEPVALAPGRHWFSVQVATSADESRRWSSAGRGVIAGLPAVLRNPGDFFGTGCVDWTDAGGCNGTDPSDLGFAVLGDVRAAE